MKTKILIATLATCLAAVPAANAKTLTFSGKATGPQADESMKITFDVVATGKGKPQSISNVRVTGLDYFCANGDTERDLWIQGSGAIERSGKFEIFEDGEPPSYKNDFYGKLTYPKAKKKGKGKPKPAKPTVKGGLSSEFGYGPTWGTFNCLGATEFKATVAKK